MCSTASATGCPHARHCSSLGGGGGGDAPWPPVPTVPAFPWRLWWVVDVNVGFVDHAGSWGAPTARDVAHDPTRPQLTRYLPPPLLRFMRLATSIGQFWIGRHKGTSTIDDLQSIDARLRRQCLGACVCSKRDCRFD